MSHTTDQIEEEILNYEISDDALDAAGEIGKEKAVPNTVPFALICIPLAQSKDQNGIPQSPLSGE